MYVIIKKNNNLVIYVIVLQTDVSKYIGKEIGVA